jgi:hypothetical protein
MKLPTTRGLGYLHALLAFTCLWAGRPISAHADAPPTAKQAAAATKPSKSSSKQAASKAKPVKKKRPAPAKPAKPPDPIVAPPEPAAALPATVPSSAQPASPPQAASKPTSPPQAASKVDVPSTSHVHVDVPPGLQAWLDADDRMRPWLAKAVAVTDACYAEERAANPSVAGSIAFTLTMHENARPTAAVSSLPAALQGMVLCVTARLMAVKMPLFTGKEGATYSVKVHFER